MEITTQFSVGDKFGKWKISHIGIELGASDPKIEYTLEIPLKYGIEKPLIIPEAFLVAMHEKILNILRLEQHT